MLFAATRTSGTVSPPDGAPCDSVAVMVAEAVVPPPSVRAVRFALRVMFGPVRTVTATEGTVVVIG